MRLRAIPAADDQRRERIEKTLPTWSIAPDRRSRGLKLQEWSVGSDLVLQLQFG